MSRSIISLNDNQWRFGQAPRCPFAAFNVFDLHRVQEWLPATVPGNVRTDLLALNRIPDPFFGENYQDSLWVENVDWWYRRTLDLDPLPPTARAFLIFEGIDYLSAIFVNGREMARHEGMFSRQIIEVTPAAQTGRLDIAVRLWGSTALPRRRLNPLQKLWAGLANQLQRSWTGVYPDRSATTKCQMSFGWDFAPPIRTMGIWDDVRLVMTGPVAILEAGVTAVPIAGVEASAGDIPRIKALADDSPANCTIHLTLDSSQATSADAVVTLTPANFNGDPLPPITFNLTLPAGRVDRTLSCRLPSIKLWQPWDRGEPNLYNVTISLTCPDGHPLDAVTLRTGFRHVSFNQWQFNLNGHPEFMRGLNWVPADCFPGRLRSADYERRLRLVRDSGANLLRIWGGGLREKRAFYDGCDELGLLVWQEFPFACMFLGAFPTGSAYLSHVDAECSAIVCRTRHHPSIILWCGGNEFSRRRNQPLLNTLARVVARYDGTRPFIPTSPTATHGGDAHNWHVWHGLAPLHSYRQENARFLSEFGLQALPHLDTLRATLPNPTDPAQWSTHHADLPKLHHYLSIRNEELRMKNGEEDSSFSILNSQFAQAAALQIAIEHMRRRKNYTGGLCIWQFNDPWPAISWSIVDYYGRPKRAFEHLTDLYHPILISLDFPPGRRWSPGDTFTAAIWAINDTLQAYPNGILEIRLDDHPIHTQTLDLPPNSVRQVGALAHSLMASPKLLSLTLHLNPDLRLHNHYNLTWLDLPPGPLALRLRRRLVDWVLW
ncbi:MAG: hypothetical protein H6633_22000 [Anaerolineales bacterium]|nr:hypothetical protein [Anaerolineales bacterium]